MTSREMAKKPGQLRIIGGQWRSRKITVPNQAEIRPTPDRVRETLFNWLAPIIQGARCLDLFAGSGALGFEALSRGASHVVMVDQSPTVIEHLRATTQLLNAHEVTLIQAKVPTHLILPNESFDIIFLDPPFHHDLLQPCVEWLQQNHVLHMGTYLYVEMEKRMSLSLPKNWHCLKEGYTTQIHYVLLRCEE